MKPTTSVFGAVLALVAAACSSDDGDTAMDVTWTFESGDCASNGVETVRVTWGSQGGSTDVVEFPCGDGRGTLGDVGESGGSFSITAEGVDASGAARAESYGQSSSFSGGVPPGGYETEITLHPAGADVVVSWSLSGGGVCPSGVVLPYFVTLYEAPAAGGDLTDAITETQETCSAGEAILSNVAPGDYVVEVDSRAVTPAVSGTAEVTVEAGQTAEISVQL